MKQIILQHPNGETQKFSSVADTARKFNVSQQTVLNWLAGKTKPNRNLAGCKFKYLEGDYEAQEVRYEAGKDGKILPTSENICTWLKINFDTFALNEWTGMLEINGKPIDDKLIDVICVEMDKTIGVNNDKKTRQCITSLCLQEKYNPLKDLIESFEWDGEERAETFFIDFLGAHDTPLNRFYTRCWLKAAIKRLYEPGCMWDHMIILYDKTGGTGKTKIFERLSLGYWTTDVDVSNKDAINVMNNAWLINFDELARFDKKGMNTLKTFITTRSETNRLAYARYAETYQRHCIFCGTTNEEYFLRDYTSDRERRFWVVNCNGTRKDDKWWKEHLPNEYIEQVWAEVKSWYDTDPNIDTGMTVSLQDDERMVQYGHKSIGNDPEFIVLMEQTLNGKYSSQAMDNFNLFKKEVFSTEVNSDRVIPLEKIQVKKLAAIFKKPESYTAAVVASFKGWLIRDGWAIKTNQYEMHIGLELN